MNRGKDPPAISKAAAIRHRSGDGKPRCLYERYHKEKPRNKEGPHGLSGAGTQKGPLPAARL